ncbi:MAG: hypothetical protein ACK5NH_01155 [Shewanella sp.]
MTNKHWHGGILYRGNRERLCYLKNRGNILFAFANVGKSTH